MLQLDNKTLTKLEREVERAIYKRSFYEFYKAAFCQLHPGDPYDDNWHAKYLCDVLQEEALRIIARKPREKDIIINVPPRSSKSMIATVIWPIWCWTMEPTMKFLRCSYSDQIATDLNRKSKDLFESAWFQKLYGTTLTLRSDLSGAGYFGNNHTGFMYAFGLDGTVTGMGGSVLLLDDPQNPKKANSEVERKNVIERYNETLSNRLNQLEIGGRIIIMQRLHLNDLTGYLLNPRDGRPGDIRHICIPAEYDANLVNPPELLDYYRNGLFWETRFSHKVLAGEKKKGSLYFAGQMQQSPVPVEGNLFKRAWIDILEPEKISRNVNRSPINFYVDTAFTEDDTEKNDPSGILAAFEENGVVYAVNFVEVWLEFPKLIEFIKEYALLNGYGFGSRILIEPKANGKSVVQQLRSVTQLSVVEIEAEWVRDDKITRATAVSPLVQARKLKLIAGDWNDKYLTYLTAFPKARHDEAVDVTVYCLNDLAPVESFLYGMM
jgi:predicted phage terminase large subunit-like protein